MRLRDLFSVTAAAALAGTPIAAHAADAPGARDGRAIEGEEIGGGFIVPLIAVLAVIVAVVLISDGGDEDPASP